jgi:hypothetical protein
MRRRIGDAVPTRYFEEASSVGFRRSVVYGLSTLGSSSATCSIGWRPAQPKLTARAAETEPPAA